MADFAQTSEEEKLQIAQHFLLASPPGQFAEVRKDVAKILPEGLLTDALVSGIARVANLRHGKVVQAPLGKKVVVHNSAEVDATHYIDPTDGSVYHLNHLTGETKEDSSVAAPPQEEGAKASFQAALQTSAESYLSKNYKSEESGAGVFFKNGKYFVVFTGEKASLKNFWSGRWSSIWTVELLTNSTYKLAGETKLHCHYFEDGNLQLNSSKIYSPSEGSYSSEAELSENVFTNIKKLENALQMGLLELYNNMNEQTLRSMRRVMPVTRTKMEWNINAVRMNRQVRK